MNLQFESGIKEFEINGGPAVLRFNPSDPQVYNRLIESQKDLERIEAEYIDKIKTIQNDTADGMDKGAAVIKLLAAYDTEAKAVLAEIFGASNDFDAIFGGVSVLAVAGNGKRVISNFLDAIRPVVEDGLQQYADADENEALEAAKLNREQRRAAAKK